MAAPNLPGLAAQVAALTERIDALETRYDQVAADAVATIAQIEQVVEDLRLTDEMSGWKRWKEQRQVDARKAQEM